MVVVGDVIVTKIIEKLVDIGLEYAAGQYSARDTRMKDELERLKEAPSLHQSCCGDGRKRAARDRGRAQRMVDLIEYATQSRPEVRGLGALQEALKKLVSSGKFLLVLDDAWNDDNRSEWDKLFAPLRSGHKGSKILLTTRIVTVAKMAASRDSCDYRKLESIGEKIAKRLGGLPLAAKTIGALLNSKLDDDHWTRILQANNISDQAQERDGVMAVLMLSYHHLSMHLRPCFAYCSIFPQDYFFRKDDLVFMWMALGLIQKSSQYPNETLEDTGRGYFDDLVKLGYFDKFVNLSFSEQHYYGAGYNMHDLLHDLACKVSHDECFTFVGDMSIDQIPNTVRHLYFETDKPELLKDVGKRKNLRALVLVFRGYVNEHAKAFEEAFKVLESIRVLRLAVDGMNVLPDAIGDLRHIRYLSILHHISRLPGSFCRLYQLRVLDYYLFAAGTVLGLNNLVSLRHLMPCEVYYEKIEGIGTLINFTPTLPLSDETKLAFFIYLWHPKTKGGIGKSVFQYMY
ncbi:putative disease resistance protein RGA3 [Asparagus officinalis]|uniref:putative disease resistance protein RGA3 n=1 Tax=Asparagus officinalis TaxID=4686 RepID=UPI00098DF1AD|nr:putative disease resistance protein RGA3 [Asparagus officinalis]